jgi:hypothetical protein
MVQSGRSSWAAAGATRKEERRSRNRDRADRVIIDFLTGFGSSAERACKPNKVGTPTPPGEYGPGGKTPVSRNTAPEGVLCESDPWSYHLPSSNHAELLPVPRSGARQKA